MSHLVVSHEGPIARLILNRPEKKNALSNQMIAALREAIAECQADPALRVLHLRGAGGVFSSGADLAEMSQGWRGAAYAELLRDILDLRKPLVVEVERYALAGAVGIVAAAHFAYAQDTAYFATPELQRGIFPMMVLSPLLRSVARRPALEMVLLGRKLAAPEAAAIGLISAALPSESLRETVEEILVTLSRLPPHATALGLSALSAREGQRATDALPTLEAALDAARAHPDAAEGISAFLERRAPRWLP